MFFLALVGFRAATPATSPTPAMGLPTSPVALAWRRPDEGEIHVDGLLEQFRIVRAVNSGSRILEGGVLDESVALYMVYSNTLAAEVPTTRAACGS